MIFFMTSHQELIRLTAHVLINVEVNGLFFQYGTIK